MQNNFSTFTLPSGMIAFWVVAEIIELIRTPTTPSDKALRPSTASDRVSILEFLAARHWPYVLFNAL